MTTTSPEASGPRSSRATPEASSITRSFSRLTALTISESAPARRTMAFRGEPDATSVARKPWARASMATKTPTVPAMPSTATMAEDQRWKHAAHVVDDGNGHVHTLRKASTTWSRIAPTAGSRPAAAPTASARTKPQAEGERRNVENAEHRQGAGQTGDHGLGQDESDETALTGDEERLGQDELQDAEVRKADGLQDGQFSVPLADGDGHGVAGDEEKREEHDRSDR